MKKLASLLAAAIFAVGSVASAAISSDKIALGPVRLGMTEAELIAACGQPQWRDDDDFHYSNFEVEISRKRGGIVEEIKTYTPGVATPDGIAVGSSANMLNNIGKADRLDHDDGHTEYEYFSTDYSRKITFCVLNGTITKIKCELR